MLTFRELSFKNRERSINSFGHEPNKFISLQWLHWLENQIPKLKKLLIDDNTSHWIIGERIGAIVIYSDLLAQSINLNLEKYIVDEFNDVSNRRNSPILLNEDNIPAFAEDVNLVDIIKTESNSDEIDVIMFNELLPNVGDVVLLVDKWGDIHPECHRFSATSIISAIDGQLLYKIYNEDNSGKYRLFTHWTDIPKINFKEPKCLTKESANYPKQFPTIT